MPNTGNAKQTLDDYQKQRVVIGVLHPDRDLCGCIARLADKFPATSKLSVLMPSDATAKLFEGALAKPGANWARNRLRILTLDEDDEDDEDDIDPDNPSGNNDIDESGGLTRDLICGFETWLDDSSSQQLKQSLENGELLLFAQINNAVQESQAYTVLSKYNVGRIQLHDMPRFAGP